MSSRDGRLAMVWRPPYLSVAAASRLRGGRLTLSYK